MPCVLHWLAQANALMKHQQLEALPHCFVTLQVGEGFASLVRRRKVSPRRRKVQRSLVSNLDRTMNFVHGRKAAAVQQGLLGLLGRCVGGQAGGRAGG